MSEMLIAGQPVDRGIFSQGRNRNWFAEVVLATSEDEEPPTGPVELSLLGTTWQGFAVRSGAPYQQARLRIIGGRGGLTTRINPRDYRVASYRQILTELLEDAGEELNVENSVGLDDMLAGWSRFRQAAVVELEQLVALRTPVDGTLWRMGQDGRIVVAPSVPTDLTQELVFVAGWPQEDRRLYALADESEGANVFAGQRLEDGLVIDRIEWQVKRRQLRLTAWTVPE